MTVAAGEPSAPGELAGSVTDGLGNSLPGVEILLAARTGVQPVARVHSDSDGRFRLSGLTPDVYRVAALKEGYLSFVGMINTRLQSWIEVVLSPAAAAEASLVLPRDSSWVLRTPRRSILRETDQVADEDRGDPAQTESIQKASSSLPLWMQVDQLFALNAGLRGEDGTRPAGHGTETRLRLESALGERGSVRLQGARQSYDSTHAASDSFASTRGGASSLSMDVAYLTTPDSQIEVKAYYSERDLRLAPAPDQPSPNTSLQASRTYGYDASWSTQLDPANSLAVKLDYANTTLHLEEHDAAALLVDGAAAEPAVSTRSVGASGSFKSLPAEGHQLQVDFNARHVEAPTPWLLGLEEGRAGRLDVPGFSLGMDARDTWRVAGPFSLVYGLGYRHALTSRDVSLIVPRVGGSWSVDALALRFLVSYHRVDGWGDDDRELSTLPYRPDGKLGYEAEIELPLGRSLSVTGARNSAPIQIDSFGYPRSAFSTETLPVYLTDGNAAVDHNRISLVRESAALRAYLELGRGSVRGAVAPVLPFELPYQVLVDRQLEYETGRFGIRVASTGTDLLLDYRKVSEARPEARSLTVDSELEALELRLIQDLLRARALGNWRLLVALRTSSLEGPPSSPWAHGHGPVLLEALNHEMSAGLSVLF